MKLIFAIIGTDDAGNVQNSLTQSGYMVTKLSSTGGFLKSGNVTFMIGVEDNKVCDVISVIRRFCSKRTQAMPGGTPYGGEYESGTQVSVGGATVFVTDVERFEKI